MKKLLLIASLFIFAFSFFIFMASAKNDLIREDFQKKWGLDLSGINETQEIRVFVKFADRANGNGKGNEKKEAKEFKEEFLNNSRETLRHDFGDKISVRLNKSQLLELDNNLGIEQIQLIGERKINLQDSVPLINASAVHLVQQEGFNLTGRGQTVCIIDTGINYNHLALGGCYGDGDPASNCKVLGGWDYYNSDANPMDDHGHGTHVAGIVAANGSIKGVAPEAKLFAMKVCSSGGICPDDDILAGINACVANSSHFNITVISMSIGAGLYSNYCNSDPLASGINAAFAKNISFVVSSGNDGSATSISAPACVQNATPVGASSKADSMASYSDRNSLLLLLAPGGIANNQVTGINSTWQDLGYNGIYGTSMAAPHVSGAIAIINQYLSLNGLQKTPLEIEIILNNTGKRIYDSSSGIYFSRIQVYEALRNLDYFPPVSSLNSTTGIYKKNTNFSANITLRDVFSLGSAVFQSNHTGAYVNYTYVLTGTNQNLSVSFNLSLSKNNNLAYRWIFNDTSGNSNSTPWNSIAISNSLPFNISSGNLSAVMNANFSLNLGNYFYDGDGEELNFTNLSSLSNIGFSINQVSKTISFFPNYNFNGSSSIIMEANDSSHSTNLTFVITIFKPTIIYSTFSGSTTNFSNLTSYVNVSIIIENPEHGMINFSTIHLNESLLDLDNHINISSNRIEINTSALPLLNSSANLTFYNISWTNPQILKDGVVCSSCSLINYNSTSKKIVFSVDGFSVYTTRETPTTTTLTDSPGGGGGGGGGGASTQTYVLTFKELILGNQKNLAKGDKIKFSLNGENHTLTAQNLGTSYAYFLLQSTTQNITLTLGQEKKINFSKDYYELYLKLNDLTTLKANLTIKQIYEAISEASGDAENEPETKKNIWQIPILKKENNYIAWIIIGVIIVLLIILEIIAKIHMKRKKVLYTKKHHESLKTFP